MRMGFGDIIIKQEHSPPLPAILDQFLISRSHQFLLLIRNMSEGQTASGLALAD